MPSSSLLSLPEEVIVHVLSFLPDEPFLTVTHTCSKLRRIGNAPLGLRERCLRYRYWEEKHGIVQKRQHPRPAEVDWKSLFNHRFHVWRETARLLDEIIEQPAGRIARSNTLVDYGYDAKDCLFYNARIGEDEVDDVLARRWHANVALRYIHRRRALQIWKRVKAGKSDVPIEEALGALDIFVSQDSSLDIEDTTRQLDELASQFRAANQDFPALTTAEKALRLGSWMREQGFRGAPPERYRALKNVLIGMTLRSVRTAIPLTLVAIYCALARRLNLRAYACPYPYHVLALVTDPPHGTNLYLDLYSPELKSLDRSSLEKAIMVTGAVVDKYLSPASTSELVIRAAENMIETFHQDRHLRVEQARGYPEIDEIAALYGALTMSIVLRSSPVSRNVVNHITEHLLDEYPMDVRFIKEELLDKVNPNDSALLDSVRKVCDALEAADQQTRAISRRNSPETKAVKHRVGTVFRHIRYDYEGVIFGWTVSCRPEQGDEWIERNNVKQLSRGPNQPFYNVLVEDGSVRYVAEENIKPTTPEEAPSALSAMAGKYFKRFCAAEGRFVSNMRHEFPDD